MNGFMTTRYIVELFAFASLPGEKSHLEDDEFSFENSQEVARLLSHDHPDLNRGSIVLVINVDSLVGASCDLIFSGMAALVQNRHKVRLSGIESSGGMRTSI